MYNREDLLKRLALYKLELSELYLQLLAVTLLDYKREIDSLNGSIAVLKGRIKAVEIALSTINN